MGDNNSGKLYCVTRRDLSLEDQAVQLGHALAQWVLDNPDHKWRNQTLVYLTVADTAGLEKELYKLRKRLYTYSEFFEPDQGNQKTAFACFTEEYNIFAKLKMFGER